MFDSGALLLLWFVVCIVVVVKKSVNSCNIFNNLAGTSKYYLIPYDITDKN